MATYELLCLDCGQTWAIDCPADCLQADGHDCQD
jgi:hypothetical protein